MSGLSDTDKRRISREVLEDITGVSDANKPAYLLRGLYTTLQAIAPSCNPLTDDLGTLGACRDILEKDPKLLDRIRSVIRDPTRLLGLLDYGRPNLLSLITLSSPVGRPNQATCKWSGLTEYAHWRGSG